MVTMRPGVISQNIVGAAVGVLVLRCGVLPSNIRFALVGRPLLVVRGLSAHGMAGSVFESGVALNSFE